MSAFDCRPDRADRHVFDAESGWCVNGCGLRDDGHVATLGSRRPAEASTTVDHARQAPTAAPATRQTHTRAHSADVLDITQPRRGADQ